MVSMLDLQALAVLTCEEELNHMFAYSFIALNSIFFGKCCNTYASLKAKFLAVILVCCMMRLDLGKLFKYCTELFKRALPPPEGASV